MDISATSNVPWDTPRTPVRISENTGAQALPSIPSTANTGLADAVGMLGSNLESAAATASLLPESTFYRWSCGHFSRPLLEPAHDDDEEILARRERREREALDGISLCQHSSEWMLGKLVKNLHFVYLGLCQYCRPQFNN